MTVTQSCCDIQVNNSLTIVLRSHVVRIVGRPLLVLYVGAKYSVPSDRTEFNLDMDFTYTFELNLNKIILLMGHGQIS